MRIRRKTLYLALVLGAFAAVPAIAQETASPYPPACDASKVSKADVERAHTVFLSGKQFLEESNYDKAISYFKDAYSIDCSIHAILPIIAAAYERKGDKGEAVRALQEYQRRAPNAPDHEIIERRIGNLKDQLAREQPAPTASAPAPVASASVVASATPPAPSTSSASSSPPAAPTAPPSAPASSPEGGPGPAPWIVAGIGGASVVAGVVTLVVGSGEVSSAASTCPGHMCPVGDSTDVSKGNDGRTLESVGVVLMSVGGAAVVGGLLWHFLGAPASSSTSSAVRVTPVVAPSSGGAASFTGLTVGGAF